ncbi:DUF3810 domain-containing protein [Myroides odoratimimus]|uniref:Amino acid permease n=1 Tax=Myroides odoratimimus CIP 101113 TaxID=883154 RepID=A0AAV3F3L3_9FLAO|nr:DUF3810 domain-containing protein [Myroides odoratimimus]EHO12599.1 hypothetical protein HMPREF9715_01754 [Myroides odoratimimus CIP 101113]
MKLRYWLILFVCSILTFNIITRFPDAIEAFYTNGFYFYLCNVFNTITSLFPFSVGDILYTIIGLSLIYKFYQIFKKYKGWKKITMACAALTFKCVVIFYILFNISWGLNNFRPTLESQLEIGRGYDQEKLINLTTRLIQRANLLQLAITNDSTIAVKLKQDINTILVDAKKGIEQITFLHQIDNTQSLTIKESLFSLPLTYMGFSGYINPFTLEAQVNNKIPTLTMIITASHEMSHQLGFAKESDANFIGFMAAYNQKDTAYQYAAIIYALRYCVSNINDKESVEVKALFETIHPGVKDNLNENIIFWSEYKNITDSFFKVFYNGFLKLNNQKEGLQSYNKFVDLLINYDLKNPIL